ncbi:hypothetical protein C0993_012425 [Termitomyces sp. T159_Od127]|nr:hypothetical protein C0993_012425 [Termitomyces sp. T159_Od127]
MIKGVTQEDTTATITPEDGAHLKTIDDGNGCVIPLARTTIPYKGHLLKKNDGTFTTWARNFKTELVLNGLAEYIIAPPPPPPNPIYQPRAYRHYILNDGLACNFIMTGVDESERQFIADEGAMQTINDIFEKIDHAFNIGKVTSDLLKSIAIIAALSGLEFMHARSIITRNFTTAGDRNYRPSDMCILLENEQTLMDAD